MKTKLFALFVALFATTNLWAYDFQCGDLYYNITSDSHPYTIEVTYEKNFSNKNYYGIAPFIEKDKVISFVNNSEASYFITGIGYHRLLSTKIPDSSSLGHSHTPELNLYLVQTLQGSGFRFCSNLRFYEDVR